VTDRFHNMAKQRLDTLLIARGLVESRSQAQALVLAGKVIVSGKTVTKPGTLVAQDAVIELQERPPYVSRGGIKLAHALDEFKVDVSSMVAADIGASTGGFTDCLLQRGARRVYAIDVGYGQLDYRLRTDPRVVVMERTNAHHPFLLPQKVNLATVDVSFISATKIIPNVLEHLTPPGYLIVLFKPQFEAQREEVGKGGIIKDPQVHARMLGRFIRWAVEHELRLLGLTPSPIPGTEGNREFFLLLRPQALVATPARKAGDQKAEVNT